MLALFDFLGPGSFALVKGKLRKTLFSGGGKLLRGEA
jgi:hypothetical protein